MCAGAALRTFPIKFNLPSDGHSVEIWGAAGFSVGKSCPGAFSTDDSDSGADSELRIYKGSGHSDILFRALTEKPARLLDDMLGFTHRRTQPNGQVAKTPSAAD